MPAPDLILHNGRIHTLDASDRTVDALAVQGNVIRAAGESAAVLASRTGTTSVIDLAGRTVVPGFYDAHPHLDRMGLRDLCGVKLARCKSIAQICDEIREAAAHTPAGEWIVTLPMGAPPDEYVFEAAQLKEGRFPDRHDLDRAAPDCSNACPGLPMKTATPACAMRYG